MFRICQLIRQMLEETMMQMLSVSTASPVRAVSDISLRQNIGLNLPPKMREAMGYATKAVSDHKHKELHPDEIFNLFKQTFENVVEPYSINEVHFQQKDGGITTQVTSTFPTERPLQQKLQETDVWMQSAMH